VPWRAYVCHAHWPALKKNLPVGQLSLGGSSTRKSKHAVREIQIGWNDPLFRKWPQRPKTRVTRLAEFSPIGRLFILGSFFMKITEITQIYGLLFPNA
jgi:hypothetical protein